MKRGDLIYYPPISRYGWVHELHPNGRVKSIQVINKDTRKFDIVEVIDTAVKVVGWLQEILVFIRALFSSKSKL